MTLEEAMQKITELSDQLRDSQMTINGLNKEITTSKSTIESLNTELDKSKQDTKFYFDKLVNQFDKSFGRETPTDIVIDEEPELKSKDEALQTIVELF